MKRTSIDVAVDGRCMTAGTIRLRFGPHYMVEVTVDPVTGKTTFTCVRTHHGYQMDASTINGQLEQIIEEIVQRHPEYRFD